MPKFILALFIGLFAQSVLVAPAPTFQPFFAEKYGTSKTVYGLIFTGIIFVAIGLGSALSVLLEKSIGTRLSILLGALLTFIGFLMVGPSPLLGPTFEQTGLWEGIFGVTVMLLGNTFPMVLGPPLGLSIAQSYGMSEEEASIKTATYAIVVTAFAQALGPVPESLLAASLGLGVANTIVGASVFGAIMLCLLLIGGQPSSSSQTAQLV